MTTCAEPTIVKRPLRALELRPLAAHFDDLADDATVSVKVFAAVAGEGVSTIWGKASKEQPGFPKSIRRGPKCTRFRVGDIRAYLMAEVA